MQKKTNLILSVFNWILLATGWIAALYAYPRLPQRIPFWLNFFGQPNILMNKSLIFFIYPLSQTLFCISFFLAVKITSSRQLVSRKVRNAYTEQSSRALSELKKEFIYLSLIFFNLIFIHIQTSLIFLAHQTEKGFNKFYFFTLFVIIIILIPYYRMRLNLLKNSI